MSISISDTSSAVSWSQVASTLPHLEKVVRDAVTDATPLLSFCMGELGNQMRAKAGIQGSTLPGVIVGGRDIQVPVTLDENSTVASYSGTDTLDVSHQDNDRYALFAIRQNSGAVTIIGREKRGNKGSARIYDLLQSKVNNMIGSLRMELTRQLVSDGTGNSGKDIDGFGAVIGTGTLAGINPSTWPVWQPGARASTDGRHGINSSVGSFATYGYGAMRTIYNNLTNGQDMPDCCVMDPTTFGYFETALLSTSNGAIEYTNHDVGWTGFKSLVFKGGPVFFDFGMPSATIYMLNSRHVKFERDSEGDFKWLEEDGLRPVDQDTYTKVMIVEGNLVTDNRRYLGSLSGITA